MLFDRCHTKNRKRSIKQHIKYLNFWSKVLLDHPVLWAVEWNGSVVGNRCLRFRIFRDRRQSDSMRLAPRMQLISPHNNQPHFPSLVCWTTMPSSELKCMWKYDYVRAKPIWVPPFSSPLWCAVHCTKDWWRFCLLMKQRRILGGRCFL